MGYSESEKEQFRADFDEFGYIVLRNVLDVSLVAEARQHVEWLRAKHPDVRPESLGTTLMTDDPFWVRLISDERLLDVAEIFVGENIALFASHYISKPPADGLPVLWHQDGSYWPLEPMEVVTLWLAVDDSRPDNGCMRVIPGTHCLPLHELRRREDVPNVLNSELEPELVDESKAVDIELESGDVSVHHPNIFHGSNSNTSGAWRRGLTIRYIPTTTRITAEGQWPSAFMLRGEPLPGVNNYLRRPTYIEGTHMPFRGSDAWR